MEILLVRIRRGWRRFARWFGKIWNWIDMIRQPVSLALWAGALGIDYIVNRVLFYAQLQYGTRLYATKSGKVVGKRDGRLLRFRPKKEG